MDNARPALDLKHIDKICPDKNGTPKSNSMKELKMDMRSF